MHCDITASVSNDRVEGLRAGKHCLIVYYRGGEKYNPYSSV